MSEISNKSLAALLVLAIVASLGGTMLVLDKEAPVFLSGFATTDAGTVNLTIQGVVSIKLDPTTDAIDWGTVAFNSSQTDPVCILDTEGAASSVNCTFTTVSNGHDIENTGNQNVSLNVSASTATSTFLDGTGDTFTYKVTAANQDGCDASRRHVTTYTAMSTSQLQVCNSSGLSPTNLADEVEVNYRITVSPDTSTGAKSNTVTYTGY